MQSSPICLLMRNSLNTIIALYKCAYEWDAQFTLRVRQLSFLCRAQEVKIVYEMIIYYEMGSRVIEGVLLRLCSDTEVK